MTTQEALDKLNELKVANVPKSVKEIPFRYIPHPDIDLGKIVVEQFSVDLPKEQVFDKLTIEVVKLERSEKEPEYRLFVDNVYKMGDIHVNFEGIPTKICMHDRDIVFTTFEKNPWGFEYDPSYQLERIEELDCHPSNLPIDTQAYPAIRILWEGKWSACHVTSGRHHIEYVLDNSNFD